MGLFSVFTVFIVVIYVFGAVDKTSSSFSAHGKIGNFIIIIIPQLPRYYVIPICLQQWRIQVRVWWHVVSAEHEPMTGLRGLIPLKLNSVLRYHNLGSWSVCTEICF